MTVADPSSRSKYSEWKHRKGGLYTIIGFGLIEADLTPSVIYGDHNGNIWVRPCSEFFDGRFERIA